jgi:hypothetical protein
MLEEGSDGFIPSRLGKVFTFLMTDTSNDNLRSARAVTIEADHSLLFLLWLRRSPEFSDESTTFWRLAFV